MRRLRAVIALERERPLRAAERRRYGRFREFRASASIFRCLSSVPELHACLVVNISYGGICISTDTPLKEGSRHVLLVSFGESPSRIALLEAVVVWVDPDRIGGPAAGLEFVRSNVGWFAPEEEE